MEDDIDGQYHFIIESDRLHEQIDYINRYLITDIYIKYPYRLSNLDFLREIPHITDLVIDCPTLTNVESLKELKHLVNLHIGNDSIPGLLDLSPSADSLQTLSFPWSSKIKGLENMPNLNTLFITGYNDKKIRNLTLLGNYPQLEWLQLSGGNLESLQGIEKYPDLKKVNFLRLYSLADVQEEHLKLPALEYLTFEFCKKLSLKSSSLGFYEKMKEFEIKRSGNIDTLSELPTKMPNLEVLGLYEAKVLSGDMTPILQFKKLERFSFSNDEHLNLTLQQAQALRNRYVSPEELIEIQKKARPIQPSLNLESPVGKWRKEKVYAKAIINEIESVLKDLIQSLTQTNTQTTQEEIFSLFQKAVIRINAIQEQNDYCLDSSIRADLVGYINPLAHHYGLNQYDDITWVLDRNW